MTPGKATASRAIAGLSLLSLCVAILPGMGRAGTDVPSARTSDSGATPRSLTLIGTNQVIAAGDTTFDGQDLFISGATVAIDGMHSFNSIQLTNGAVVTHSPGLAGLNLTVTADLGIGTNSAITVAGLGYQGTNGVGNGPGGGFGTPGAFDGGGGGGYGGAGGFHPDSPLGSQDSDGSTNQRAGGWTYGSIAQPVDWGSAGGAGNADMGAAGGGAVRLAVGGTLRVDGVISADGNNATNSPGGTAGGGAGGSIWISAGTMSGSGGIHANGGKYGNQHQNFNFGGGGGGGRVAFYVGTNAFSGTTAARGGLGVQYGGAGTIYTRSPGDAWGELLLDNGGNAGVETILPDATNTFDRLIVQERAQLDVPTNTVLALVPTVFALQTNFALNVYGQVLCAGQPQGRFVRVEAGNGGSLTLGAGGQLACDELRMAAGGTVSLNPSNHLACDRVEVLDGGTLLLNCPASLPAMHVASNGVVSQLLGTPVRIGLLTPVVVGPSNLLLTVTGDLTVDAGGTITLSGHGYQGTGSAGEGPGGGFGTSQYSDVFGGGGGHGGAGGVSQTGFNGGGTYGSVTQPTNMGSAGGAGQHGAGGRGGGVIEMTVGGTLRVDGVVSANGDNGHVFWSAEASGGGGAGGSIWITAGTLTGGGSMEAMGGTGGGVDTVLGGGGGGGGRIAVYYDRYAYSGSIRVDGGGGYQHGQPGTIFSPAHAETPTATLLGPAGHGPQNFVAAGTSLPYRVDFANVSNAAAPVQSVCITNPLPAGADAASLELTSVGFGDRLFAIPPHSQHYQHTEPVTFSNVSFNVEIEAGMDPSNSVVYASFQSLDPSNGLPPSAGIGFLPPEDGTGRGQGCLAYTVRSRTGLPTGTELRNLAWITFDGAARLPSDLADPQNPFSGHDTNKQALVTLDGDAPASAVSALASSSYPNFSVSWSGSDIGGGLASFDIYVSTDGGAWTLWLAGTTNASATFQGQRGHAYQFRSVAQDGSGNAEVPHATADTQTAVPASFVFPLQFARTQVVRIAGAGSSSVGLFDFGSSQWQASGGGYGNYSFTYPLLNSALSGGYSALILYDTALGHFVQVIYAWDDQML